MDNILLLISAVLLFATALVTLTRQLHFLQLNSYYNSRFFDYFKDEFNMISVWSLFGCAVVVNLAIFEISVAVLIASAVFSAIRIFYTVYKLKNAKKKIAFTARIKRFYVTAIIIFGIILTLSETSLLSSAACVVIANLVLLFSPFFACLLNIINAPLEKGIKKHYINDAKKILKSKPDMKIIGLTGSYGKTSTKYILGRILSEKFNTVITPGSFNTPMGVVITVRNHLTPQTEVFVVEMGAKNVGDIKEICEIAHPTTGVITSVGPQHLNTFGSIENVTKTKFELADEVKKNGGKMYLNADNEYICAKVGEYDSVTYSIGGDADIVASNVKCDKNGLSFTVKYKDKTIDLSTELLGSHNVLNIMAAVGIALDMGMSDTDIKYAVESLKATEHRLELKPFINGALLIDDAYNANPSGSLEAMRVIGSFSPMKRIVVTPGLVELGEKEEECNEALGLEASKNADVIILVGEKRSVPIKKGVLAGGFDEKNLYIAKTFNDAVEIFRPMCDKNTVVIFENDLPDNYAK
ncbi:MAG: UDP-N-acetylmuramoyl-tripeptide--D-alanyl-D-alanine ligase [Acutalibacteraceae bacterium]|nr:UDP-N-acetylmuramoyl-tripeptide--D-alanyl-D-alanine ligase [Acutalibacteraceae bacterium]